MRTPYIRQIAILVAFVALTACTHFELIRSSSDGPSPSLDHCPVCMDLGQAWAFFRMGAYDEADDYCTLVIEEEASKDSQHARRARDIHLLSRGYLALRAKDYSAAQGLFGGISDPQLRALGQPYLDSEGAYLASVSRVGTPESESLREDNSSRACVLADTLARAPRPMQESRR